MSGRVAGKSALITGAAQGLGEATAKLLAAEGAKVAVTDINGDGAAKVAEAINAEHPGAAFAFSHDVTSDVQWRDVLARAHDAMGGLNVLVNNAGIGPFANVEDVSLEEWRNVHAIDLDGVFMGCKFALPLMRDHAPGSIINVSSIAGLIAGHNVAAYNSAKAGVWLFSKSVALHCAKRGYGIRCNTVHPTFIDTPILDGLKEAMGAEVATRKLAKQVPLGCLGEPNDVAYAVLFLASDESKFITGSEIKIDGGISAM